MPLSVTKYVIFRSSLKRPCLSACFRISEEGLSIKDFNPDPTIDLWYQEKVRRLGSSTHKYKKRTAKAKSIENVTNLSLSDFESDSSDSSDNNEE